MMAASPRTAKEALLAEALGDLDALLSRLEKAQAEMDALAEKVAKVQEAETSRAADSLAASAAEFGRITTRSVDDFVTVANEALHKFMGRTEEIKELLSKPLQAKPTEPQKPEKKPTQTAAKPHPQGDKLPLLVAVVVAAFSFGGLFVAILIR